MYDPDEVINHTLLESYRKRYGILLLFFGKRDDKTHATIECVVKSTFRFCIDILGNQNIVFAMCPCFVENSICDFER